MTKSGRGRAPRIIGESCLAAALALTAGLAPAAAVSEKPVQELTPPPERAQNSSVAMPALGESETEGTVVRWHKGVGDPVEAGETLVEVESNKANVDVPAPASGVLLEITVSEGQTAAPGATLGVIGPQEPASAD